MSWHFASRIRDLRRCRRAPRRWHQRWHTGLGCHMDRVCELVGRKCSRSAMLWTVPGAVVVLYWLELKKLEDIGGSW